MIDTVFIWCEKHGRSVDDVVLDTNDTLQRVFRSKEPDPFRVHCCKTSNTYYSFKHDRCLLGVDHAGLLGFNAPSIEAKTLAGCQRVSDQQARSLFGNGLALPHIGLVMTACAVALGDIFE